MGKEKRVRIVRTVGLGILCSRKRKDGKKKTGRTVNRVGHSITYLPAHCVVEAALQVLPLVLQYVPIKRQETGNKERHIDTGNEGRRKGLTERNVRHSACGLR